MLKCCTVTRGNGEVFCLFEYSGNYEISSWSASVVAQDGCLIPFRVITHDLSSSILMFPIITQSVSIEVSCHDIAGNRIESFSFRISPGLAKRCSQIGTALKDFNALQIRNVDEKPLFGETLVGGTLVIATGVSYDILEFNVETLVCKPITDLFFEPLILDHDGHPISEIDIKLMGDAVSEDANYPGFYRYKARYSALIPADMTDLVIWAESNCPLVKDGFKAMQGPVTHEHRLWWQLRSCPSEIEGVRYEEWFACHRTRQFDLDQQRLSQHFFKLRPKFSVVVPLYHTPIDFFNDMASSVLGQTYDNLELVLVNSTPDDEELALAINKINESDPRVVVVTLGGNLGITENTNAGIDASRGDFISFFDHDDVLEPDLFFWYVKGINDYPNTDMLYCDEDKLENGRFSWPFFKPDFDMVFLETNNYICHLLTVRKSVLDQLTRPDSKLDGAQDHSMALSVGEIARNVYHARKVLYHWRIHSKSTAANANAKPESLTAGKLAIDRHLARIGLNAEAIEISSMPHCFRTSVHLKRNPKVLLIPYSSDGDDTDAPCLAEISESYKNYELALLSPEYGSEKWCEKFRASVEESDAEYVLVFDRELQAVNGAWITDLLGFAARESMGVIAPKILYPNGTIRDLGFVCSDISGLSPIMSHLPPNNIGSRGLARLAHQVSAVDEICVLASREAVLESKWSHGLCCGLLWYLDLCASARDMGLYVCVDPTVEVILPERTSDLLGMSKKKHKQWCIDRARLSQKWPSLLTGIDPFCNYQMKQDGYYGLAE